MSSTKRRPYSREALERLAVAFRVDSAVLWFNNIPQTVDKKLNADPGDEEEMEEWLEAEE